MIGQAVEYKKMWNNRSTNRATWQFSACFHVRYNNILYDGNGRPLYFLFLAKILAVPFARISPSYLWEHASTWHRFTSLVLEPREVFQNCRCILIVTVVQFHLPYYLRQRRHSARVIWLCHEQLFPFNLWYLHMLLQCVASLRQLVVNS